MECTLLECPASVASCSVVRTSHSLIVPSALLLARSTPSAENATDFIQAFVSKNAVRSYVRVSSRSTPTLVATARLPPSGEYSTAW